MDKTKAQRNLTWRERRQRGVIIAPVELEASAFTAALIRKGVIEAGPVSREALVAHAGAVLRLFCEAQEG